MNHSNCHVLDHPLAQHKLTYLRKIETHSCDFRRITCELGNFMAYEATREVKLKEIEITTPLQKMQAPVVDQDLIVVSILRAGNGMLDGILQAIPTAKTGFIGIYRDKFINDTVEYYFKIPPKAKGQPVIVCDPMVATGDTLMASLTRLKEYEVGPITVLCLLSCDHALKRLNETHPDVKIMTLSVEAGLNEKGYLLPGLGDAGDRIYGTL